MSNYKIRGWPIRSRRLLALFLASVIAAALLAGCSGNNVVGVVEKAEPANWWDKHEITFSDQLKTQENVLALLRTNAIEHRSWLEERWKQAEAVSTRQVVGGEIESPVSGINRLKVLDEQMAAIDHYYVRLESADRLSYGYLVVNRLDLASREMFAAYWLMNDVVDRDKLTQEDIVAINNSLARAAQALELALPPAG